MRLNIYHHEVPFMAERTEVVKTVADTGNTFYGLRFYTEPPLMHQPGDDDSSAITLWVPWTNKNGHSVEKLRLVFERGLQMCAEIEQRVAGGVED